MLHNVPCVITTLTSLPPVVGKEIANKHLHSVCDWYPFKFREFFSCHIPFQCYILLAEWITERFSKSLHLCLSFTFWFTVAYMQNLFCCKVTVFSPLANRPIMTPPKSQQCLSRSMSDCHTRLRIDPSRCFISTPVRRPCATFTRSALGRRSNLLLVLSGPHPSPELSSSLCHFSQPGRLHLRLWCSC